MDSIVSTNLFSLLLNIGKALKNSSSFIFCKGLISPKDRIQKLVYQIILLNRLQKIKLNIKYLKNGVLIDEKKWGMVGVNFLNKIAPSIILGQSWIVKIFGSCFLVSEPFEKYY
ncbi:MAG: hypothetical protein KJO26_11845 [Deltaproteobacteria bacterium]|nr:hypothetical protein [Deltaproteobacteria bacterium]